MTHRCRTCILPAGSSWGAVPCRRAWTTRRQLQQWHSPRILREKDGQQSARITTNCQAQKEVWHKHRNRSGWVISAEFGEVVVKSWYRLEHLQQRQTDNCRWRRQHLFTACVPSYMTYSVSVVFLFQCLTNYHPLSLLQKVKSGMGSPDWNVSMVDTHLRKLLRVYCPGPAGVKENDRADRLVHKATLTNGLPLRRSEVLRSLRRYPSSQNQEHHTMNRLEERGVDRGSTRWSSLKGQERAIIYQMNIGTVLKATLGKLLRDGVARMWAFLSA